MTILRVHSQLLLVCLAVPSMLLLGQATSVEFRDSYAVYGPEIFPAVTRLHYCAPYRVLVAYINGTDMLFVDKLVSANGQSTFQVSRGVSVQEFNYYEQSAEISEVACGTTDEEALQITGKAYSFHSDREFTFTISFADGLEHYRYNDTQD